MGKLGDYAFGRKTLVGGYCSLAVWGRSGRTELIVKMIGDRMPQFQHMTASNRLWCPPQTL